MGGDGSRGSAGGVSAEPDPVILVPPIPEERLIAVHGACVDHPEKWWWWTCDPRALTVCGSCTVRPACRKVADHIETRLPHSASQLPPAIIWGGEMPRQRWERRNGMSWSWYRNRKRKKGRRVLEPDVDT